MWHIGLRMANLAKRGTRVKNVDDVDETRTVLEKCIGSKTDGKLSPMDLAKGLWARNGKIGWTGLLLAHQFP